MIEFQVLGSLALVRRDGQEASPLLVRPKQMALLAYLALRQPRGWHRRNSLLAMFWPESDDRRARFSLRSALHALRTELGADAILARGDDELMLNPDVVHCDALAFEDALDANQLEPALALYRGPFLEGLVVTGLADFHIWSDERRDALRRRAVAAAVALADGAEAGRDMDQLLRWNRRALDLSPHEESLLRRELRTLEQRGERAEALAVYEQWATRLRVDLDSEPSPETLAAVAHLRAQVTTVATAPARRVASYSPPKSRAVAHTSAVATPVDEHAAVDAPRPLPAGPKADRGRTYAAIGLLIAFGLAAVVTAFRLGRPTRPTVAANGTAVLPFTFSGEAKLATLADAVSSLLSAALGDAGPLRTIDPHLVAAVVGKQPVSAEPIAAGARSARDLHASHFIIGSIVEQEGVLRIQAYLYAAGHEDAPLGAATATGSADSIFSVVDRLATSLLAARLGTVSVDAIGTTSVPALRAYVEGEREMFAAQYARAADAYTRAVAADSNFARAYYRLSYAASLGSHDGLSRSAAARADSLKYRLPAADQILVDAWLNTLKARIPMAIELYEKALTQDTRNPEAWLQLAEIRYHWGPMLGVPVSSAAEAFQHVLASVPDNAPALIHLARIEARDVPNGGGFDTLSAAARRLNITPTEDLELRALSAVRSGRAHDRDTVLAEAAALGAVTQRHLLSVLLPFVDTTLSTSLARALIRSGTNANLRAQGFVQLAQIAVVHGRIRAALRAVDSLAAVAPDRATEVRAWILALPFARSTAPELSRARDALSIVADVPFFGPSVGEIGKPGIFAPRRLYLEGALSLLLEDTAQAVARSRELVQVHRIDSHDSAFAADFSQLLLSELRLRATPTKAADAFAPPHIEPTKTYPDLMSYVSARERFLRAESLAAAGHTSEAIAWFETFPEPAGTDAWFLGPALFRRAQLYEASGRRDTARRDFERFIALWRDADAELAPMVKQARDALAKR